MKYLAVPYEDKEEVKRLGAKWDYETRLWWCEELERFSKWKEIINPPKREKKKRVGAVSSRPGILISRRDFSLPTCECQTPPWKTCKHVA
jgi:hypothetical protein